MFQGIHFSLATYRMRAKVLCALCCCGFPSSQPSLRWSIIAGHFSASHLLLQAGARVELCNDRTGRSALGGFAFTPMPCWHHIFILTRPRICSQTRSLQKLHSIIISRGARVTHQLPCKKSWLDLCDRAKKMHNTSVSCGRCFGEFQGLDVRAGGVQKLKRRSWSSFGLKCRHPSGSKWHAVGASFWYV